MAEKLRDPDPEDNHIGGGTMQPQKFWRAASDIAQNVLTRGRFREKCTIPSGKDLQMISLQIMKKMSQSLYWTFFFCCAI